MSTDPSNPRAGGRGVGGRGGGILRSRSGRGGGGGGRGGVTFSSNFQSRTIEARNSSNYDDDEDDDDGDDDGDLLASSRNRFGGGIGVSGVGGGDEYDSDEVEDAILASGDALSMDRDRHRSNNDRDDSNDMMDDGDGTVKSLSEIEQARRMRGRVRRQDPGVELDPSAVDYFDHDDGKDDDVMGDEHDLNDASSSNNKQQSRESQSLSLIENHSANPDAYESNAGSNASCPVEPFNMNAEQESGMGYFDGDTYVFRQGAGGGNNKRADDEEEDAWLDGFRGQEEEEGGAVEREGDGENEEHVEKKNTIGGSDSTAVWNPNSDNAGGTSSASSSSALFSTKAPNSKAKKAKYIPEDATPEDIGRRIATLLEKEEDTVMLALTRHGATLRDFQAKEQRLSSKKKRMKFKKGKKKLLKESCDNSEVSGATNSKEENDNDQSGEEKTEETTTAASSTEATPTHGNEPSSTGATTKSTKEEEDEDPIKKEIHQLKIKMQQTRQVVEELTELADALLFSGETDAYDLTRRDWIHRFHLEKYFPAVPSTAAAAKRPLGNIVNGNGNGGADTTADEEGQAKKARRGYFDDDNTSNKHNDDLEHHSGASHQAQQPQAPQQDSIMWEYKGNEDGAIHGPFTSRQMMEWVSCGFFVGASAVDIRRVGSMGLNVNDAARSDKVSSNETEKEEVKTDVDDLMADLMDDDDDGDGGDNGNAKKEEGDGPINAESTWVRSDEVDFSLYL